MSIDQREQPQITPFVIQIKEKTLGEARRLGHKEAAPGHWLLGMTVHPMGISLLRAVEADADKVKEMVEEMMIGEDKKIQPLERAARVAFNSPSKDLLTLAVNRAIQVEPQQPSVTGTDLLYAMVINQTGIPAAVLARTSILTPGLIDDPETVGLITDMRVAESETERIMKMKVRRPDFATLVQKAASLRLLKTSP